MLREQRGNTALLFALLLPVMVGFAGVAIDYTNAVSQRSKLQGIADASALAAAREFRLGNANPATIALVAANFARAELTGRNLSATVAPSTDTTNKTVTVRLAASVPSFFKRFTGVAATSISVSATARMVGGAPICVIGLDTNANSTVLLDKNARLQAPNCSVYSNSQEPNGLMAKHNATMAAAFICSAGGKSSPGPGSFTPTPQTDCPVLPDPLLSRPLPVAGACTQTATVVNGGMLSLTPGTYCNGLTLTNNATVTMSPGVYVFKDGPLLVTGGASLSGSHVNLHFSGSDAVFNLDSASSISLTAPVSGNMAGILISEDRNSPVGQQHQILSNDARTLLGTIYLPQGLLYVGANNPVADQSAYTIVVVRQFSLSEGPTMILNTNYGGTNIPVPSGVGPNDSTILTQ
ncbi:MAG: pilus assembly protein TadG-related protein [Hyphomicrobiales bacterium]